VISIGWGDNLNNFFEVIQKLVQSFGSNFGIPYLALFVIFHII